jgi:hypothetical protein
MCQLLKPFLKGLRPRLCLDLSKILSCFPKRRGQRGPLLGVERVIRVQNVGHPAELGPGLEEALSEHLGGVAAGQAEQLGSLAHALLLAGQVQLGQLESRGEDCPGQHVLGQYRLRTALERL